MKRKSVLFIAREGNYKSIDFKINGNGKSTCAWWKKYFGYI